MGQSSATLPPSHRVYAISDVHGCLRQFQALLERIRRDDAKRPAVEQKLLIMLGDYVDRGPNSYGVIEHMLNCPLPGFKMICLMGNHEDMMLKAMQNGELVPEWLDNGAEATFLSYGIAVPKVVDGETGKALAQRLGQAVPWKQQVFLNNLTYTFTVGDYFFVHAGVRPGVPLDHQRPEDCLWIRGEFLGSNADFGKIIVHGHTPVQKPEIHANRIAIDTGCCFTGRLTALRLEGEEQAFLST